jgi:hypothetical protein
MAFSLRSKVIVWLELGCRPVETADETAENTLLDFRVYPMYFAPQR